MIIWVDLGIKANPTFLALLCSKFLAKSKTFCTFSANFLRFPALFPDFVSSIYSYFFFDAFAAMLPIQIVAITATIVTTTA
jgi:hypothetical protein